MLFFTKEKRGSFPSPAGMMELADVLDSKSSGGDTVRVRPPLPAPRRRKLHIACGDFFTKVTGALITLRLLFRKRSRLLRLLACKRAHNAFAALPTFCGVREFKSLSIKMKTIFFVSPLHVVANYVSFAATFLLIGVIFSRSFYKFKTSKILF